MVQGQENQRSAKRQDVKGGEAEIVNEWNHGIDIHNCHIRSLWRRCKTPFVCKDPQSNIQQKGHKVDDVQCQHPNWLLSEFGEIWHIEFRVRTTSSAVAQTPMWFHEKFDQHAKDRPKTNDPHPPGALKNVALGVTSGCCTRSLNSSDVIWFITSWRRVLKNKNKNDIKFNFPEPKKGTCWLSFW